MASVQGIGLSEKHRREIAEYKRTIGFEGQGSSSSVQFPSISCASIGVGDIDDDDFSQLDNRSLRIQNPGQVTVPSSQVVHSSLYSGLGSIASANASVSFAKESSIAGASFVDDGDASTVYTAYTEHLKSARGKKTQWLTMANKVLRFYAYSVEQVSDSQAEADRVRKFTLYYYLENDTIQVSETRQSNSGLTGGKWCQRSKVINSATGAPFITDDFAVGRQVIINGRQFVIYDADDFTRSFYPNEMPAPQPVPVSSYDKNRIPFKVVSAPMSPRVKTAIRLGIDKPEGGEVLDFFGKWDDTDNEFGVIHDVKLSFFTEDRTVDLKVADGKPKRGRQMYKPVLARSKVPRELGSRSVDDIGFANNYAEGFRAADSFIDVQDLFVGETVIIYNRKITITMCSRQTAQWWSSRGRTVPQANIQGAAEELAAAADAAARAAKKPTEEDIRRAEMKAFFARQAAFGTKALRFAARDVREIVLNSAVTVPSARTTEKANFTINFHLDDSTISVNVAAVENTGGPSGKFLRRMKAINPATGQPFKATDLTPGTVVTLPNATLEVIAMDSFTHAYLSGDFKRSTDLRSIFEKLRAKIAETRVDLRDVYLMIDRDRNGRVDQDEFMLLIDRGIGMGILSPDEVLVLFKKFDQTGTGSISWNDFVETMKNKDAWHSTPSLSEMDSTEVDRYVSSLWSSSDSEKEQLQLERAMKTIQTFGQQMGLMNATKLFREFDLDHNGTIDLSEFRTVLTEYLFLSEKDVDLVIKKVWPSGNVNYENFFKIVNRYEDYKQTGRNIARNNDNLLTSPKTDVLKRINDLLAQPLGSNGLKRVLLVEQMVEPGMVDPSFSSNDHRFDTVPLANGIIKAGVSCKVFKYSSKNLGSFVSAMENVDGCIVRFPIASLDKPYGAKEQFLLCLEQLEARGKAVWPDSASRKALESTLTESAVNFVMVRDQVVSMEPNDSKFLKLKEELVKADQATLLKSLHNLDELPLLWKASYGLNPDEPEAFILSHYSCDCVDIAAFKGARGNNKDLKHVKDSKYFEGQVICDAIGIEVAKKFNA